MNKFSPRVAAFFAFPILFLTALSSNSHAQQLPNEYKRADIFAFTGFASTNPDYGPRRDTGALIGVDYTRYVLRPPFAPSLELRANFLSGPIVNEHSYLIGPRIRANLGRYHPYGNFLIGLGQLNYAPSAEPLPGYTHDSGRVFSTGGGIDIDIYRNFQLKADIQHQSWNLGINTVVVPDGRAFTLSPTPITLGISYRIPFRPYISQQDVH